MRPEERKDTGREHALIFREVEDRDLILKARRGDVDAYNILVSRWEKRVYNYLLKLLRNREDALDLSQDTFLKAYRALARLDDPRSFPKWIFRIAHNEAISHFRKAKWTVDEEPPEQSEGRAVAAGAPMLRPDLHIAVASALDRLPPEQREAVVLKVYEGFKFHEIAEIQECPVSTAKSRVYHGFDALRDVLAPMERMGETR